MLHRLGWPLCALLLASALACSPSNAGPAATPTAPPGAGTATATDTPTPPPISFDVRATRLVIPALGLDAEVQRSRVIPVSEAPPGLPGCPVPPPGTETLTVPDEGIASPEDAVEGLESAAWIFGHSRWQGRPGLLRNLEDINIGDELLLDGVDRRSGAPVTGRRFVVDGIYLSDTDSGGKLVASGSPALIAGTPVVILQTSVREQGADRQWLLDQQKVLAKSRNAVPGDLNDPCKYLLLFVFAHATS